MQLRTLGLIATTALLLTFGFSGCAATELRESLQSEDRQDNEQLSQLLLPVFRALDTDDDGHISTEEIEVASESLVSLDDNGDGRLSGNELRPRLVFGSPANLSEGTRVITRQRATGDNSIEMADLPPEVQRLMSSADTDGDGTLSAAELRAMMAAQDGEPSGVRTPLMVIFDTDQDGVVSHTEVESAPQSLRKFDGDGDGLISPKEFRPDLKQE